MTLQGLCERALSMFVRPPEAPRETPTKSWSVIVNDPKEENYLLTSGARKELLNNYIIKFAPGHTDGTCARWNALQEIDWGTDREFSQVLSLSTNLADPTGEAIDGSNGHWVKSDRALTMGIALKVAYDPTETLKTVPRIAQAISDPQYETFHELLDAMCGTKAVLASGSDPQWLLDAIEVEKRRRFQAQQDIFARTQDALERERVVLSATAAFEDAVRRLRYSLQHPVMQSMIMDAKKLQGDEAASVLSSARASKQNWLDPRVVKNTAESDWKITDICSMDRPVSVYLVSPIDGGDMIRPIMRLWFTMALSKLHPPMKREGSRLVSPWRHRCLWIWDEMGELGKVPNLESTLPVTASYGHKHFFVWQTMGQATVYGELDKNIVLPNCHLTIYHTPQDAATAEAISKRTGERTLKYWGRSIDHRGNTSRNIVVEGRPLLTAREAEEIDANHGVLFAAGIPPVWFDKVWNWKDQRFNRLTAFPPAANDYTQQSKLRQLEAAMDAADRVELSDLGLEETSYRRAARLERTGIYADDVAGAVAAPGQKRGADAQAPQHASVWGRSAPRDASPDAPGAPAPRRAPVSGAFSSILRFKR